MAEAEDVLVDAARHATTFAQRWWRAHRSARVTEPDVPALADVAERLELLLAAALGAARPIRAARTPAPRTLLRRLADRAHGPRHDGALPGTDGARVWLPARLPGFDAEAALATWRTLALQQAMRAARGGPIRAPRAPAARDLHLLVSALAADAALVRALPGAADALARLRTDALRARPPLDAFPPARRPLEAWLRERLAHPPDRLASPLDGLHAAAARVEPIVGALATELGLHRWPSRAGVPGPLLKDAWTGEWIDPGPVGRAAVPVPHAQDDAPDGSPRSARLARRPEVREPDEDEDDREPGAWMVQSAQPSEHVEDPVGMQRPTDRDEETAAEDFADSLSELPEARLVSTPGPPKEVLLSDDPPEALARAVAGDARGDADAGIDYPEWDWRAGAYREPGARVRLLPAPEGPQAWIDRTLDEHRSTIQAVRRRFELLRAQRVRLRRQDEGEDVDLAAWIDARADAAAGRPMPLGLYETTRTATRSLAITLLIDVSGSTDAWVGADRRIVDVEREALLLCAIALDGLGEPHAILAFSGEGPRAVTVRTVKGFRDRWGPDVARRIAGLEPEHYTRAGAAIRHATSLLMREPARHRLLMLLSDGRPNDVDEYEGRYGVEDVRQAVVEAQLQGVYPFCLAIDRHASDWLPRVFGPARHARLTEPKHLPAVLLDWMRRLVGS